MSLLIIWHSRTGASEQMAQAAMQGCRAGDQCVAADAVTSEQILEAGGYLFVCPENLGSMTGAMKEMFDRTYYDALGRIEGRPYSTIIAAGSDGEGALRQIDRIATGWRLRRVAEAKIVNFHAQTAEQIWALKTVDREVLSDCEAIGAGLSEGVALGVF
ncbi:flavodoxin family protein [Erythrobacter sp. W53]|uniref:flavodoxin family protein n=1 Tax=Erythrobacter sp. W53 TaxID=3425947 RepID=UPI003D766CBE